MLAMEVSVKQGNLGNVPQKPLSSQDMALSVSCALLSNLQPIDQENS
jgi:hypothetical protein